MADCIQLAVQRLVHSLNQAQKQNEKSYAVQRL